MIRYAFKTSSWLPTELEWLRAANTVNDVERERIAQFMFRRDAKQSMMGRLLMRTCFSEITRDPPHTFSLLRDQSGKPYLEFHSSSRPSSPASYTTASSPSSHPASSSSPVSYIPTPPLSSLSFNVSHAGDYAVFVGCGSAKVGVDVMKVELRRNTTVSQFFSHMTRQFTNLEWKCIEEPTNDQDKLSNFYRHWCLKESFVKCMGTGLKFGLQRIEFHVGDMDEDNICTTSTVNIDGKIAGGWRFEEVLLDNHFISTAINSQDSTQHCNTQNYHNGLYQPIRVLEFSDLILNPIPFSDAGYFSTFHDKRECPN